MKTQLRLLAKRGKLFCGKIILVLLFTILVLSEQGKGQILAWQLNGKLGNETTVAATTNDANLNVSSLARGSGLTASALGNAFSSANYTVGGTKATAISTSKFVLFTVNAKPGYQVSLATLDARFRRSSSGPNAFRWQYSIDGINFTDLDASDISYTSTLTGGDPQAQINLSGVVDLQNVANATTITIRLLGWGATATTGTFAIGRSLTNGATDFSLSIGGTVVPFGITATLGNITQPAGSITQGNNDVVLAGFTLGTTGGGADFSALTVTSTGTATSSDLSNMRIFRDNDGNGSINGADAAVSVSAQAYSGSMAFTFTSENGITSTRNYLIVGDVAGAGFSTVGNTTTLSILSGGYTTTAPTNSGSAAGNPLTIAAPNTPTITLTGSIAAFSSSAGTPTLTKNYSISGINLTTDIVIVPPAPFEISLDTTLSWTTSSGSINLTPVGNTVNSTTIYVRYNPVAAGSNSGDITHNSTGAIQQLMHVTGSAIASPGPLLYGTTGSTYFQDFNGLPASGAVTNTGSGPYYVGIAPVNATGATGWQYARFAGSTADVKFTSDNGSINSGAAMSYGTTSNSDRALGTLLSGANSDRIGVVIKNITSDNLNQITIAYAGEQWRLGNTNGNPDHLNFSYSLNGTDISSGTYTSVSQLDLSSLVTGGTAAVLNGDVAPNRTVITYTFTLTGNWAPGQLLILRWNDFDVPGSDDGLAVDSFSFKANLAVTPTLQDSTISFSAKTTTSMTASWLNGDGTNHLVAINTSNSFTNPADGNTYTANNVYAGSGQQFVYDGTGNSVNVSGLTPGTNYFFRVYGYNGIGVSSRYDTVTATLNPNNDTTAPVIAPKKFAILSVNGGINPYVNTPFSVVVQSQDSLGNPQPAVVNTNYNLIVINGVGTLASGNISGTIDVGTTNDTITGVIYDLVDFGVQLQADWTSGGDSLESGQSASFDVLDPPVALQYDSLPSSAIVNTTTSHFVVTAITSSNAKDPSFYGPITLSVNTGPVGGTMTGTLTRNATAGSAIFNDIQFTLPGTYTVQATSPGLTAAISTSIIITAVPTMTELVIPKYIGSKSSTSTNDTRTPIAMCIRIDNLVPNTTYNIAAALADTSEANTVLGAGTTWNDTAFVGANNYGAFTTDGNGSSGPYWIFFQASTNATHFAAGQVHNLRVHYSTGALVITPVPDFIGTHTISALDIPTSAYTPATTDDGAFLKGSSVSCIGGKFVLIYDNENGTGDPLYSYQARQTTATATNTGQLPTTIADVFAQTGGSTIGDYAAVIPIGANNPNGVRRIEIRRYNNTIQNFATDADGIWPGGANTTTIARRGVAVITSSDAPFNTTSVSTSSTPASCFGALNGTVTAVGVTTVPPISYLWSQGATTDLVNSLGAGTYTVTASDADGCSASSSTSVSQPTQIVVTGTITSTECTSSIGAVDISVSGGAGGYSYAWSNSSVTEDISGLASGTYTVTVTDANTCTATASFFVQAVNTNSPLLVSASPASVCPGSSSTLTASGAVTYTWSPATNLNTTSGDVVISTPSAAITYTVTGVDGSGCASTGTVSVGINQAPVINASATTICSGQTAVLSTASVGSYLWSTSETTSSISVSTAGAYTVAVDYGNGCVLTSSATNIIVNTFVFNGTLYSENMGNPAAQTDVNAYTGWQNTSPIVYQNTSVGISDVRTTTPSSGYAGASGNGNIFFGTAASSGGNDRNFIISGINTLGYSNDTLSFGLLRNSTSGGMSVSISSDGGLNYTPLTFTQPDTANKWRLIKIGGIPAVNSLTILFAKNNSTQFRLDDVKIVGSTTTVEISANGPLTACSGTGLTLSSNIPSGNLWSYDGSTAQSLHISAVGPFTTTVTAIGSNGCPLTSASVSGLINPSPSVAITSITNETCFGDSIGTVTALASGGTGTLLYSWSTTPVQTTPTITNLGAGIYIVTATDDNSCTGSASASVTQPSQITITVAVSDTSLCDGQSINLNSSGSTSKAYTASNSTPVNIPDSDQVLGVQPVSSSVTVSGLNITALAAGQIANVKINSITHPNTGDLTVRLVSPDGTYLTLAARRGTGANFTNTLYTPSATNLISAANSPFTATYIPDTAVTAAAAFSIFNGVNPNGTWSLEVIDSASTNAGTIDSWNITFLNPLAFSWTSSPAGFTSTAQSPGSVTPSTLGLGNVTYTATATNSFNGCSASNSFTVTVNPAPVPSITGSLIFCAGSSTTLGTALSYSGYLWSNGSTTSTLVVTTAGTYTVTVTDNNGCTGSQSEVVTQYTTPNPVITGNTSICSGTCTDLQTTQSFSGYVWSNGTSTVGVNSILSVCAAGSYTVIVTDINGCTGASTGYDVSLSPSPTPQINAVVTTVFNVIDSTSSVGSYAETHGMLENFWIDGVETDTLTLVRGITYTFMINSPTHRFYLTTDPVGGFLGSDPNIITNGVSPTIVFDFGVMTFTPDGATPNSLYYSCDRHPYMGSVINVIDPTPSASPLSLCAGETATLSSVGSYSIYDWTDGIGSVGSTQSISVTPSSNTTYTLTVTDANGCTGSSTFQVNVTACGGGVTLNAKMYFEGYYAGSNTGLMDNYGAGGCLFINGVSTNANDADTVEISMMDAATYAVVDVQKAILQVDGTVSVTFGPAVTAGTAYYIRVKHRSAVQTWSANPVMTNAVTTYDFTTAQTQAYGSNMVQTNDLLHWAFFSGDFSDAGSASIGLQDEVIESQDYSDMENAVFVTLTGYTPEDITGDGVVESLDYSIIENNVFFVIFSQHP